RRDRGACVAAEHDAIEGIDSARIARSTAARGFHRPPLRGGTELIPIDPASFPAKETYSSCSSLVTRHSSLVTRHSSLVTRIDSMTLLNALVEVSNRVGATSSRTAKVRELASTLRALEQDEIEIAVQYLAG